MKAHTYSFIAIGTLIASAACTPVMARNACSSVLTTPSAQLISSQFKFTEGPVWSTKDNAFIFSDIPANTLYHVNTAGTISVFDDDSGYANGNTLDSKGNLYSARHDRVLSMQTPSGKKTIIADTYKGGKLNSPNDVIVSNNGDIWFTDPPFGIQGFGPKKAKEEQAYRGAYKLSNGKLTQVDSKFTLPNGLAFDNTEEHLYIAEYSDGWVYKYDVKNGELSNKKPFAKAISITNKPAVADGLRVDKRDNLWVAGADALHVFDKKGNSLCKLPIDSDYVTNLAFGGKDGKRVLLTAGNKIYFLNKK